jgi:hypothetical protein
VTLPAWIVAALPTNAAVIAIFAPATIALRQPAQPLPERFACASSFGEQSRRLTQSARVPRSTILRTGLFRRERARTGSSRRKMSENIWYHIAVESDEAETAMLWMVLRDERGYTCRTWQLAGFERRKIEAWMRMVEQRRTRGLAIDPPPDIGNMAPEEARFAKIHEARAYLGTSWNPLLRRHAAEFFRQIDPAKYPG